MSALTRSARWAALEAVWCQVAAASARRSLGSVAWQTLGSCGARTDLPWTAEPADIGPWDAESMRTLCMACSVLSECAAYFDTSGVCAGWWAGTNRDPDYVAPPVPRWVKAAGATDEHPAWQGVLPIGGAA